MGTETHGILFSGNSLARASQVTCLYNGTDIEDPSTYSYQFFLNICFAFICILLKDLIGFCFLFGFLPVLCHDQMDGDSEEEQESPDTGEDEDGGDESDLVIWHLFYVHMIQIFRWGYCYHLLCMLKVTGYPGVLSEGKKSLSVVAQAQIVQVWWSGCWDPVAGQTFLGLCLVLREGCGSIFLVIHTSGELCCVGCWEAVGLELCWGRVSYLAHRICRFVGAG